MALLFMDGFDHTDTSSSQYSHHSKWSGAYSGQISTWVNGVRTGRSALFMYSGSGNALTKGLPAVGGFVVGVAVKTPVGSGVSWSNTDLIQIREGGALGSVVHLAVGTDATDHLVVRRGSTVIATGTRVLVFDNWYYIEFKGTIDATTGTFDVRLDGTLETGLTGFTGNTRNGGTTGQWNRVCLINNTSQGSYFDDFYACDQSGSLHNDFLGICRIETMVPVLDVVALGTYHDWIVGGQAAPMSTDHASYIDDLPPNEADYCKSAVVGAKETFRFPTPTTNPVFGALHGMQTNLYTALSDIGSRSLSAIVRSGGADYEGAAFVPAIRAFQTTSEMRAVNPNTGLPWTLAEIPLLEVGIKVAS